MIVTQSEIKYEVKGLRFGRQAANGLAVAIARGDVNLDGDTWRFELVLTPVADGEWRLVKLGWDTRTCVPAILGDQKLVQALVNCSARLLDTINIWPSEQTSGGARLSINERVIPKDVRVVPVSLRDTGG